MNHDVSRNQSYEAVLAGRYSNIRMLEMGKNQRRDGGAYDYYTIPPPPPVSGRLEDGTMSPWSLAAVGNYSSAVCRQGGGPVPKDMHTPCPECCSTGTFQQSSNGTWYWSPNDQWLGSTIDQFSAVAWHFATSLTDEMEASNGGEGVVPLGLIGSCVRPSPVLTRMQSAPFPRVCRANPALARHHHATVAAQVLGRDAHRGVDPQRHGGPVPQQHGRQVRVSRKHERKHLNCAHRRFSWGSWGSFRFRLTPRT